MPRRTSRARQAHETDQHHRRWIVAFSYACGRVDAGDINLAVLAYLLAPTGCALYPPAGTRCQLDKRGVRVAFEGPGFHVEIGTIEDAAKAMDEITRKQDDFSLEDLCGRYEQYGHDKFCDALDNFCDKFSSSVDMLVEKSDDMQEGLTAVAKAYRHAEHSNKDVLKDPGVQAVEDH